jgi:CRP/FNR family transcriptional regulator, cyclic AMP receptor protein
MTESGSHVPEYAFQFLTSDELAEILPLATSMVLEKGKEIFHAGDPAGSIYFLETGRLAVLKETGFNDRSQVVALLEQGASVGEGGSLDDSFRTATIVAIEDSLLYCLERRVLTALGEKNPFLLLKIVKRLLYAANLRLQKSSERLAHIL